MRHTVGLGLQETRGDGGRGERMMQGVVDGGVEGDLGVYFKKQGTSSGICFFTLSRGGINV